MSKVRIIEMGEAVGLTGVSTEMAELWVVSNMLAEDEQIPEARWREEMALLANEEEGEPIAPPAGLTGASAVGQDNVAAIPSPAGLTRASALGQDDNAATTT